MSTSWPNTWGRIDQMARIDQIDDNKLTQVRVDFELKLTGSLTLFVAFYLKRK